MFNSCESWSPYARASKFRTVTFLATNRSSARGSATASPFPALRCTVACSNRGSCTKVRPAASIVMTTTVSGHAIDCGDDIGIEVYVVCATLEGRRHNNYLGFCVCSHKWRTRCAGRSISKSLATPALPGTDMRSPATSRRSPTRCEERVRAVPPRHIGSDALEIFRSRSI